MGKAIIERKFGIVEAAKLLGIKPRTVREWIRNGKLKAQKPNGSYKWLISESEIDRLNSKE